MLRPRPNSNVTTESTSYYSAIPANLSTLRSRKALQRASAEGATKVTGNALDSQLELLQENKHENRVWPVRRKKV